MLLTILQHFIIGCFIIVVCFGKPHIMDPSMKEYVNCFLHPLVITFNPIYITIKNIISFRDLQASSYTWITSVTKLLLLLFFLWEALNHNLWVNTNYHMLRGENRNLPLAQKLWIILLRYHVFEVILKILPVHTLNRNEMF